MYFDKIKLEKLLQGALNRYNIPGLAACVMHEGKIIYKSGFGLRNVSPSSCVNSKTIFGVASITKLVTALIIKQAENENILKTSDLVSAYVPDLSCLQNTKIEIRHLLNHSAGFPGLPTRHKSTDLLSSKINDEMKSFDDLVRYLNKLDFDMLAEPGKLLNYSNEGYCLLGCIIERLYNNSFISVATEKVFEPLSLSRSFIGMNQAEFFNNIAEPLEVGKKNTNFSPIQYWDAPLFYSAGGLMTTVEDMGLLISHIGSLGSFGTSESLTANRIPVTSRNCKRYSYGSGLEIDLLDNSNTLIWHTGQRPGISSFVGYLKELRLSVALAINIADAPTARLGRSIFKEFLKNQIELVKLQWPPKVDQNHFKNDDLSKFTGIYGSLEMGNFNVFEKEKKLFLQYSETLEEFKFSSSKNGNVGEHTFKFLFSQDQRADALALDLRVLLLK